MKKLLVVLLAVAMVFCFAATAMATTYSDMADQTSTAQDAVAFNSALGIVAGYPDGTFGPAKNITRAEFAKIAVNAAGLSDSADYMSSTASKFSDVKVGAWYNGYVNLAQGQGFIKGYPDGTFRPNATITNQEVVTVLMRMLGYDDRLTGPWPIDYINKAVKLDILDDVKFVGAAPATRVDVAIMTKATLDAETVGWDNDKNDFLQKTQLENGVATPISLLSDSFGSSTVVSRKTVSGLNVAGATPALTLGDAFSFTTADAKLTLNSSAAKAYTMTADTVISDGLTLDQLAGQQVNLVLKNAGKTTETVAYVDVTSYTKTFDKINTNFAGGKIKMDDKNYTTQDGTVAADFAKAADSVNKKYIAYFNKDDEVYAVVADAQVTGGDISVLKEDASSKGKAAALVGKTISVSNDADAMIIKNGAQIKATDLKKYDVVTKYNDLYLVTALKPAKMNSYYGTAAAPTAVNLDGTKYTLAASANAFDSDNNSVLTKFKDYVGTNVNYALNAKNQVVAIVTGLEASTTIKGVVTDFTTTSGSTSNGALDTITVFTTEGKTVTYNVNNQYEFAAGALTTNSYADDDSDGYPEISLGSYVEFTLKDTNTIKSAVNYAASDYAVGDAAASSANQAKLNAAAAVSAINVSIAGLNQSAAANKLYIAMTSAVYTAGKTAIDTALGSTNFATAQDALVALSTNSAAVDTTKKYINIGGSKYNVTDKTVVFNLTTKADGNIDDKLNAEILPVSSLLSGDNFDTKAIVPTATRPIISNPIFATVDGLDAKVIIASNANAATGNKYGFLSEDVYRNQDNDRAVKFVGNNTEYVVKNSVADTALTANSLWKYTLNGTDVTFVAPVVAGNTVSTITAISGNLVQIQTVTTTTHTLTANVQATATALAGAPIPAAPAAPNAPTATAAGVPAGATVTNIALTATSAGALTGTHVGDATDPYVYTYTYTYTYTYYTAADVTYATYQVDVTSDTALLSRDVANDKDAEAIDVSDLSKGDVVLFVIEPTSSNANAGGLIAVIK